MKAFVSKTSSLALLRKSLSMRLISGSSLVEIAAVHRLAGTSRQLCAASHG
jgi:hypothetical protein